MLNIASQIGFACSMKTHCVCSGGCTITNTSSLLRPLMLHNITNLDDFSMQQYNRIQRDENSVFLSPKYPSLKSWKNDMDIISPYKIFAPVCYGGVFAVKKKHFFEQINPKIFWEKMEHSLARGNNIVEGHYAERSWGVIFSSSESNHGDKFAETLNRELESLPFVSEDALQHDCKTHMDGLLYVPTDSQYGTAANWQ
mmetsp:Transcript_27530/g.34069  ORF Transcript_27530/g.34069 Transcript_27530/m.34069 type:complete len:198 (+) Transcript_27530:718-1311(+)